MLFVIGLIPTLAPVVYVAPGTRPEAQGRRGADPVHRRGDRGRRRRRLGRRPPDHHPPSDPGRGARLATLLSALAFAAAGGGQNLVRANWIRDKGLGMGAYVPRLVSPITGQPEAKPSTGYVFEPTTDNLSRWKGWWKFANIEQIFTFVLITFVTILFTSLLAYSTVFGREGLANDIGFIKTEGEVLAERVRSWLKYFFWNIGSFSLFAAALGIVDYTSRLAADVLKTSYARRANESKMYAGSGLGPDHHRHRRPAGWLRPADRAARDRRRGRRVHDVRLLRAADPHQPQDTARAQLGPRPSTRHAGLGDPALRAVDGADLSEPSSSGSLAAEMDWAKQEHTRTKSSVPSRTWGPGL